MVDLTYGEAYTMAWLTLSIASLLLWRGLGTLRVRVRQTWLNYGESNPKYGEAYTRSLYYGMINPQYGESGLMPEYKMDAGEAPRGATLII